MARSLGLSTGAYERLEAAHSAPADDEIKEILLRFAKLVDIDPRVLYEEEIH